MGKKFVFRGAEETDIEKVSDIIYNSWCCYYRDIIDNEYLEQLQKEHWIPMLRNGIFNELFHVAVVTEGKNAVGASILAHAGERNEVHLAALYLSPGMAGQGIGKAFYTYLEQWMRNCGYEECSLDVLSKNQRALRFYRKMGFQVCGALLTELGNKEYECLKMKKNLTD